LRQALIEYYGAINEMKTLAESQPHIVQKVTIPDKPEALILWQQCRELDMPLVDGGLEDQPHIWLEEISIILEVQHVFEIRG